MESALYALLLTTLAGGSTIIGAFLGVLNRKPSPKFISFLMAVSAGVMVFLSFVEMFAEAEHTLGMPWALVCLSIGLGVALLIDVLLPETENVHDHLYSGDSHVMYEIAQNGGQIDVNALERSSGTEAGGPGPSMGDSMDGNVGFRGGRRLRRHRHRHARRGGQCKEMFCVDKKSFMKLGLMAALALFIHNVPEGLATFSASLLHTTLGVEIALATALHNIPEGICVAVPVFVATGNKRKAILFSAVSGMAEPAGALVAWAILSPFINDAVLTALLGFVAGIMVYVSVDTLIPAAKNLEHKHTMVLGFTLGMMLMGVSLIFI